MAFFVFHMLEETVEELPDVGVKHYTVNTKLSKPDKGWPAGKYRVDITMADEVVTTARFTVE